MVYVYTDGSSNGGRGDAGYSWIIVHGGEVTNAGCGHLTNSTNNLAELEGAIQGLIHLSQYPIDDPDGITVVSDSKYVLGIADGSYVPHTNLDSAERLRLLAQSLQIHTEWVRGHNGHQMNEIADVMARMGRLGYHKPKHAKRVEKKKRKLKRSATNAT